MYRVSMAMLFATALFGCDTQQPDLLGSPLHARCLGETDGRPFLVVEYNLHREVAGETLPVQCEVITFGCEGDRVVRLSVEPQPGVDRACTGNVVISDPNFLERIPVP